MRKSHQQNRIDGKEYGLTPLKLIVSPLADGGNPKYGSVSAPESFDRDISYNKEDTEQALTAQTSHASGSRRSLFKPREEANHAELFFDLFFVANLTVFSSSHEITNGKTLSNYIGFFTILWFTWLQVTIFDARFSVDSIFDRVCKALQFGVMVGFAVIGPKFETDGTEPNAMQTLSLILMGSRLLLMVQYATILLFARRNKEAILPLVLKITTLGVAAAAFLGISFSFIRDASSNGHIGWYIVSLLEAAFLLAISSGWSSFSFRNTCLPERVGLLTLIILGEGVIGFGEQLSKIGTEEVDKGTLIGMAICSVLITYFLFLLYFDQVDPERFGTVRQGIWTIAHYPLHLAFLLSLIGANQLALFILAFEQVINISNEFPTISGNISSPEAIANSLNSTFIAVAAQLNAQIPASVNETIADIAAHNLTETSSEDLQNEILLFVFNAYGYTDVTVGTEGIDEFINIIATAFLYLFIAAGISLITLAGLLWLGKRNMTAAEYGAVGVRGAIGVALCLISLMNLDSQETNWQNFVESAWPLPTVMLSIGLVLLIDRLLVLRF